MKKILLLAVLMTSIASADFYSFTVNDIDGSEKSLKDYTGKVVLVVNVASRCGHTRQYKNLVALDKAMAGKDFAIVAFPANNYGGQEPGTNEEIKAFCSNKFDVTFDIMAKLSTKGDDQAPLYAWLTDETKTGIKGGDVGWNFEKFLIGKDGKVIQRYNSGKMPDADPILGDIKKALGE